MEICQNLTAPENQDINDKVQTTVNNYLLYGHYMEIPQSIISLYLGPLSGEITLKLAFFTILFRHRSETPHGGAIYWSYYLWNSHDPKYIL